MKRLNPICFGLLSLAALSAWSAQVHVVWQTSADGEVKEQGDVLANTDEVYTTCEAPRIEGYVFTGWTIDTKQAFVSRDAWGRSLDSVPIIVYEPTVLTANYHLETVDSDADGLSDAKELYWYGNLDQDQHSDTDGDGFTLLEEFTQGLNPHLPNRSFKGVATTDGMATDYNPNAYPRLVMRCEPDGELFATTVSYVKPGKVVTTPEFDPYATRFAYWSVNGVRQVDAIGQALNVVAFAMPSNDVVAVAVCEMAYENRARLHWYGDDEVPLESDSDGDGRSLADELAAGTNPLLKDRTVSRGVTYARSGIVDYNPNGYPKLTIACDPEGVLFKDSSRYVPAGTTVDSPVCRYGEGFMGWTFNGIRQHDVLGRALDEVSFDMPNEDVELLASSTADADEQMQMYWYGDEWVPVDSDTDGDGYSLAAEVAAGTNPLLKDRTLAKGVAIADTQTREVDIQPYEQMTGALVDGKYAEFFTSPTAGNAEKSRTFADGAQIWPVVGDVNGDGLWDLIVCGQSSTNVFLNVGSKSNPEFEEHGAECLSRSAVDLQMNSVDKLESMTLDIEPTGGLSASTNGITLLVSDDEGRIWYYTFSQMWTLHHKVWGGSHAGFAHGLMLAVVDWEDDGDLDCLCGTADGKLMLLRDPRAGRPTNLQAMGGVDNVLLNWDPNVQSRVRGYRVYRAEADQEAVATDGEWRKIADPSLPTHRDYPEVIRDYDYRVTSVSRFYTAGNSVPVENESVASEAVRAELGKVVLRWGDAAGFVGEEVAVDLGVENSLNIAGEGLSLAAAYDEAALSPIRIEASGLTKDVTVSESSGSGVWTVTASDGAIAAGGGTLFRFVFKGLRETDATTVALSSATFKSVGGSAVLVVLPKANATVLVAKRDDPGSDDTSIVIPYSRGDLNGDGRLTKEDKQLMARLMNGGPNKKWSADELRAGDYNGNGRLDQDDYQLMKDDFKKKGIK